jgi:hypothetical protein
MASNDFRQGRMGRALVALAALAATAIVAAPAQAADGKGSAEIVLAQHKKGRTLSGQGVNLLAGVPASRAERIVTLPISSLDPNANPSATADGSLSFKRGKRVVSLTGIRFHLSAGTISGNLGGEQLDVFRFAGGATANGSSGAVGLVGGKLRLTKNAAKALRKELNLVRALRHDGVGMAWLAAQANPTHEAAKAVTSGVADWGVRASWRGYVLSPPVGSISVSGGATASGPLSSPATIFGFPSAGGSYTKGLYGASDRLVLNTQGAVSFAKPGHCIMDLTFSDVAVTIDGANSSIALDSTADVNGGAPPACAVDNPPVGVTDVIFAKLDLSAETPTYSSDGKTITWSAIPGSLTAAGAAMFGGMLKEGAALDPITITVGIG